MREIITTIFLALGASSAYAQLGAVISAGAAIPTERSASPLASTPAQEMNWTGKDNLQGLEDCWESGEKNHFACVRGELAKLKKKNVLNSNAGSDAENSPSIYSYSPRAHWTFAPQLARILRGKPFQNAILPAVKASHFRVPSPQIKRVRSDERSSDLNWARDEISSEFKQAKSYVLKIPNYIRGLIGRYAKKYSVDPNLALSMVKQESGGNRYAVSKVGAMGLGQLMPATARRFGVENPFDPRENIRGMVRYLRFLQQKFNNDKVLMVAAYNSGEGRKSFRYGLIPRFHETVDYVKKVFENYFRLTGIRVNYNNRIAPRHFPA